MTNPPLDEERDPVRVANFGMQVRDPRHNATFALGIAVLCIGCASVDPGPFNQFASSLQSLRAASDSYAPEAAATSRAGLVQKVADEKVGIADLQLQFDESHFTAIYELSAPADNFLQFAQFRDGLSALNDAMLVYAESLVILAGGGEGGDVLPTADQFDQMAQDLNANAGTAAAAFGVSAEPRQQALLSVAAIELFRAYIHHQRRKALADAIAEVQAGVEEFSAAARRAVELLAEQIKTEYIVEVEARMLANPLDAKRILALNDTTQETLATLGSLSKSYSDLPAAHRDLPAAATKGSDGLAGVFALHAESARLKGLVRQLEAANAAARPPR